MTRQNPYILSVRVDEEQYFALQEQAEEMGLLTRGGTPNVSAMMRVILDLYFSGDADAESIISAAISAARTTVFLEVKEKMLLMIEQIHNEIQRAG